MISRAFFERPHLLLLAVMVILAAGLSAYELLPRMEDPVLGQRIGIVTTVLPGAAPARVESLVTEPLEEALLGVGEIKQIQSTSRAGVSTLVVELRDEIRDVDPVWSRIGRRLSERQSALPTTAQAPNLRQLKLKAHAAIVALSWQRDDAPQLAILDRLAADLQSRLRSLEGTEDVVLYGQPEEQVVVEIPQDTLASLGLSVGQVAQQLEDQDGKRPAGELRGKDARVLLDVAPEEESLSSLADTPIHYGGEGKFVQLGEVATISKSRSDPPGQLAFADGAAAVMLGVYVRDDVRIDRWTRRLGERIDAFADRLPRDIGCELLFAQSRYVERRLSSLLGNLALGMVAVVLVMLVMMGWRSTLIMAAMLPLTSLMVLAGMRAMRIPIHQMSVTGLIIAMGLLIDNVIVMVDEVRSRIFAGAAKLDAVGGAVRHLGIPLFGSTLTTTLAFAPIAMLPGPPGEFVGSIAVSVILAINASFLLAMTVVPALTALMHGPPGYRRSWMRYGVGSRILLRWYEATLAVVLRWPLLGAALAALLPVAGLIAARSLPEQFFPPSDRDQIQVELELETGATLEATRAVADSMRQEILSDRSARRVHWFVGASAPTFYYNVVARRSNAPYYAQAMVELTPSADPAAVVARLQARLSAQYRRARVLVRQLEQGPPFDAPIEIRVTGPDLGVLQAIGSRLRLLLSRSPSVIATRSDLEETLPKLAIQLEPSQLQMANLTRGEVARQLFTASAGLPAGALLDGDRQLPIVVRQAGAAEMDPSQLASFPLRPLPPRGPPPTPSGPPQARPPQTEPVASGPLLGSVGTLALESEVAAIPRVGGRRSNELKAYLSAGALPSEVVADFRRRMRQDGVTLPPGYKLSFGGEAAKRDDAVSSLLARGALLFTLILVTLVLSFQSFRVAAIIAAVGGLSIGLGVGALWLFRYPFGFMAIIGTMGLVGVAINDAIVVMAGIRSDEQARRGDASAIRQVVIGCTRHVLATTLTTIVGFIPLLVAGGQFWPPLAITIAGGVGGATLLALYFVPAMYMLRGGRHLRSTP